VSELITIVRCRPAVDGAQSETPSNQLVAGAAAIDFYFY